MTTASKHSLYQILNLPEPHYGARSDLSEDDLKSSYRRALLLHHPDKALQVLPNTASRNESATSPSLRYSIDDIVHAYRVLSDPESRRQYDSQLQDRNRRVAPIAVGFSPKGTHPGVEAFDLDDLQYQETEGAWYNKCRCGNEAGYRVTEQELERESDMGEIYVECQGCSLFIKVLFGVSSEREGADLQDKMR